MGFRCPQCHTDFGMDKKALALHFMSSPICAIYSATLLSSIKKVVSNEDTKENEK